ncbi:MAG: stage V sporulation protein AC [Ruminococcaceae bacterium]|nr:stage V sporulation protein AC [Oscillospiraceae bacterium]
MNMTKDEYRQYIDKKTPNSTLLKDLCFAFIIGGFICIIGQLVTDGLKSMGLPTEAASGWTSVIMVFLGAFLTGVGVYDKIAKYAGAGTIVPITGFANSVVSPAMEFKSEGLVLGLAAKMFIIAGPVIVYGILSSVITGTIYYVLSLM